MHEGHAYMQQHSQKQRSQVVYLGTLPVVAPWTRHGDLLQLAAWWCILNR